MKSLFSILPKVLIGAWCIYSNRFFGQAGEELAKAWMGNTWVNFALTENHFDETFDGCRSDTTEISDWNNNLSLWNPAILQVRHYDDNGNIFRLEVMSYQDGSYQGVQDIYSFYDNNNLVTYDSLLSYSFDEMAWIHDMKVMYSYDEDLNLTQSMSLNWIDGWVPANLTQNTYDEENNLVERIQSYYEGDVWMIMNMDDYVYENGQLMTNTSYMPGMNDWQPLITLMYSYGANELPDSISYYYYMEDGAMDQYALKTFIYEGSQLTDRFEQSVFNGDITNLFHYTFSDYCTISMQIEEFNSSGLILYPNPAADKISFQSDISARSNIFIYNAAGQIVKEVRPSSGSSTRSIDVSDLTPGVYLFQSVSEFGHSESATFIVRD